MTSVLDLDALDFEKGGGVVTVVAQDARSNEVLMVAFADRLALKCTLSTGEMHYHSRARGLWRKGATSGNVQRVVSLHHDCDADAVLARVIPAGPACHTGTTTCFAADGASVDAFDALDATILARQSASTAAPTYTQRLLHDRNLRLKKIGEEAAELVVACADGDTERAIGEAADVFYHMMVALRAAGAGIGDLRRELAARAEPLTPR